MASESEGRQRALLDRQVELLQSGDLDALIAQYHPDAVVLRFDRRAQGQAEIRRLFEDYVAARPRLISLDAYAESDDALSYQATMRVADSDIRTYGVFVLRDGKIWRQVAGVFPPGGTA